MNRVIVARDSSQFGNTDAWTEMAKFPLGSSNVLLIISSTGNNRQSPDIVQPNFENVRPISHYDWTGWPNISSTHVQLFSARVCQSINNNYYVQSNLWNVWPKGRFERTYVPWATKNYFQHCTQRLVKGDSSAKLMQFLFSFLLDCNVIAIDSVICKLQMILFHTSYFQITYFNVFVSFLLMTISSLLLLFSENGWPHKKIWTFSLDKKKNFVASNKPWMAIFYSFLHSSLSSAAISKDASLVCGGFEDSSILLWSLTPKKLVHPRSKPEISKIQLSPGTLELFFKVNVFLGYLWRRLSPF